jgi:isopentenyl-diphosphate delta-isomerase
MNKILPSRKSDHIRINMEEDVQSGLVSGLDDIQFIHQALPECDLDDVNTTQEIFDRIIRIPLFISSMTGGTKEAESINRVLAEAASETGIGMGLGSLRAAIEDKNLIKTYQVRKYAPNILLFSNLGAIQLNYGFSSEHCQRAVDAIEADALILHLNALQEALQPEGEARFKGLLRKIEEVCKRLSVPVVIKEVGYGISEDVARLLEDAGVSAIDVAGAGGVSWSQVEMYRIRDESLARVAGAFRDWGIPTAKTIQMACKGAPNTLIFASGGLRSGVDIAKCLALGASLGGMAGPFLKAAVESKQNVKRLINEIDREIKVCMFLIGAENIEKLKNTKHITRM